MGNDHPRQPVQGLPYTRSPNPSWGTITCAIVRAAIAHYAPNPSWGTITSKISYGEKRVAQLLTPHGERSPALQAGTVSTYSTAPNPSWGTITTQRHSDGIGRFCLLTPHGERSRCGIRACSPLQVLLTPHGERSLCFEPCSIQVWHVS